MHHYGDAMGTFAWCNACQPSLTGVMSGRSSSSARTESYPPVLTPKNLVKPNRHQRRAAKHRKNTKPIKA